MNFNRKPKGFLDDFWQNRSISCSRWWLPPSPLCVTNCSPCCTKACEEGKRWKISLESLQDSEHVTWPGGLKFPPLILGISDWTLLSAQIQIQIHIQIQIQIQTLPEMLFIGWPIRKLQSKFSSVIGWVAHYLDKKKLARKKLEHIEDIGFIFKKINKN